MGEPVEFIVKVNQGDPRFLAVTIKGADGKQEDLCKKAMQEMGREANRVYHLCDEIDSSKKLTIELQAETKDAAVALFQALQRAGLSFKNEAQILETIRQEGDKMLAAQQTGRIP